MNFKNDKTTAEEFEEYKKQMEILTDMFIQEIVPLLIKFYGIAIAVFICLVL